MRKYRLTHKGHRLTSRPKQGSAGKGRLRRRNVRLFAVLVLALFASPAFAQQCPPGQSKWGIARGVSSAPYVVNRSNRSIVQLRVDTDRGRQNGSGTLIGRLDDDGALILTAAHVVDGAQAVQVVYRFKGRGQGEVVAVDRRNDLALIAVDVIPDDITQTYRLSDELPAAGDKVFLCGYGGNDRLTAQEGRLVNWQGPERMLVSPAQARHGDSGGPVCDASGRLIGVVSEAASGVTVAPCCRPVYPLLRAVCQRLGRRAAGIRQAIFPGPDFPNPPPRRKRPPLQDVPSKPKPPEPAPEVQTVAPDLAPVLAAIDKLNARLDSLELKPGPAGPPGPQGPKGDAGPPGKGVEPLTIANLNMQIAELQSQVAELSKPLQVEVLDPSGKVAQRSTVHLGKEPLRLQLIPVKPKPTTTTAGK